MIKNYILAIFISLATLSNVSATPLASEEKAGLDQRAFDQAEPPPPPAYSPEDPDLLTKMANEVDALQKRLIVQQATEHALQTSRKVKTRGARTMFNYSEDAVFEVLAAKDHVTDVALEPGETLTMPPTAGDTTRWNVAAMRSGPSQSSTTHLIVKPLEDDIETNLLIATDRRTYHLRLVGSATHMPSVAWHYPHALADDPNVYKKQESDELRVKPEELSYQYEISGDSVPWKPIRAFDDGVHTYIQMPPNLASSEAPALFTLDESDSLILTNYRVKGAYYIVDRLFERALMKIGEKSSVEIQSTKRDRSFFERLFDL